MTKNEKALLSACGIDAQDHPVVTINDIVRFKADPVISRLQRCGLDLNELWKITDLSRRENRLSLRKFYRNMGYSLCGYIDVFGEQLDEEESR